MNPPAPRVPAPAGESAAPPSGDLAYDMVREHPLLLWMKEQRPRAWRMLAPDRLLAEVLQSSLAAGAAAWVVSGIARHLVPSLFPLFLAFVIMIFLYRVFLRPVGPGERFATRLNDPAFFSEIWLTQLRGSEIAMIIYAMARDGMWRLPWAVAAILFAAACGAYAASWAGHFWWMMALAAGTAVAVAFFGYHWGILWRWQLMRDSELAGREGWWLHHGTDHDFDAVEPDDPTEKPPSNLIIACRSYVAVAGLMLFAIVPRELGGYLQDGFPPAKPAIFAFLMVVMGSILAAMIVDIQIGRRALSQLPTGLLDRMDKAFHAYARRALEGDWEEAKGKAAGGNIALPSKGPEP